MAPVVIITVPCDEQPCNLGEAIIHVANLTTMRTPNDPHKGDYEGAARFIIATVLVYSLMGVFGMLLLRIKRSATRSQRSTKINEQSAMRYMKETDRLMLEARRDLLRKETQRMSARLNFVRQKSETSYDSDISTSSSLNQSKTSTTESPSSVSLMTPLLPTVQEISEEIQTQLPQIILHFPTLALAETPLTFSSTAGNSIPIALVRAADSISVFPVFNRSESSNSSTADSTKMNEKSSLNGSADDDAAQPEKNMLCNKTIETNNNVDNTVAKVMSLDDSTKVTAEIGNDLTNTQAEII